MPDSVSEKYFKGNQSFLFNWTDHGRELCWLDGTTIAFHEELAAVFNRLALSGLPNFPSVVLGMAALRASWPDVRQRISRLLHALQNSHYPTYAAAMQKHATLIGTWPTSSRKLELLTRYATANATSVSAKAELLGSLFDRFESAYSKEEQCEIAATFAAGLPEDWVIERRGDGEPMTLPSSDEEEEQWRSRPPVFHRVLHDVLELVRVARILATGLHDFSDDDLKQKVDTGIAHDIVTPAESPLDAPQTAGELLHSLQEDAEFSGIANLTRHLIAAVSLPRSLLVTQDVRAGGVSDITNRGQLDQLLLSELAFDDLTLAVRIASNEAMYLRHETPPSPQADLRPVLIDTSLPMWGIPKLYATAMALALHVGAEDMLTIQCFRANGSDVDEVPLGSRQDIADQLAALSPTEHAGAALPAFEAKLSACKATTEPVLITTSDTLASHTFRYALDQLSLKSLWIICVERDGRLQVMQRTRQGTSIRKKIHLPLQDLLSNGEEVRNQDVAGQLPAILGLEEFPLRLSHEMRSGRAYLWGDYAISFAEDGRLMLWDDPLHGARQLCNDLPSTRKRNAHLVERRDTSIEFLLDGNHPELVRITRPLEIRRTKIDVCPFRITDVKVCGTEVLAFENRADGHWTATAISRETGDVVSRLVSYEGINRNGRCFIKDDAWHILTVSGGQLMTQPLGPNFRKLGRLLETEPGRFVAIENGVLIDPDYRDQVRHPAAYRGAVASMLYAYVAGSGCFTARLNQQAVMIDAEANVVESMSVGSTALALDYELKRTRNKYKSRNSHWRFRGIYVDGTNGLRLAGRQGCQHEIVLQNGTIILQARSSTTLSLRGDVLAAGQAGHDDTTAAVVETAMANRDAADDLIEFSDCPRTPGVGYSLRLAEWASGSKAWLDSRGLMHLKNANSAYPEVTLVLRDGQLSGWLSTGEVFGHTYYCGRLLGKSERQRIKPEDAWESSIKPFLGSVPWSLHYSFDTAAGSNTLLPEY